MKKQVKIIGLSINQQFGILQATKLAFDQENRLHIVKGEVGAGKTSLLKALQLGTQGKKTLQDQALYGKIDTETQLLDGDTPVFVGCRSSESGTLQYTIYTKNEDGKVEKNPVIDGQKATPKSYLELLQTELTWRMDELTSENPTVQKKILLNLYQDKLTKVGVVFNKKDPAYKDSILHKIEKAEENRTFADAIRKQKGGIADDLKARGFDVTRPDTLPERINIDKLNDKYRELDREIAVTKSSYKDKKEAEIEKLKTQARELLYAAKDYNQKLKDKYDKLAKQLSDDAEQWESEQLQIEADLKSAKEALEVLQDLGYKGDEVLQFIETLPTPQEKVFEPIPEPDYILIENDKIKATEATRDHEIVLKTQSLRKELKEKLQNESGPDTQAMEIDLQGIQDKLKNAAEINSVCDAVDSFYEWQEHNNKVQELKAKYEKLLTSVETGVDGLKIMSVDGELFLMYNGSYDPKYFNNTSKEYRKLSSYSGTQKPVVCLLVQSYLLNQKPKSMRYMYIDNVPMDRKTIALLEDMSEKLDVKIFLNITGDFEAAELGNGEILIDGGEIIAK